jgi:predicted MFS family arabinose efflux permease
VGLLAAFQRVPFVFLTLFAGVWLDRVRRRPVMIVSDIGRAVILAAVPLAAFASALSMPELYVAAVLLGICTVFFDVGVLAFLPGLIGRDQLPEGYTKLDTSISIAGLVGPGLGGLLIQALTAPIALLANSGSYLISAAMMLLIRRPEPDLEVLSEGSAIGRIRDEILEGLQWVFGHAILRSIVIGLTLAWFGVAMVQPLILVFAYRSLHFTPSLMGAILTVEGVSSLVGLWLSAMVVRRLGLGRTMWVTQLVMAAALFAIPLARFGQPVVVMAAALVTFGVAVTIQDLNQVTLRQFLTPDRLQGRMNSIFRLFYWGSTPVASFVGGVLGDRLGASTTITIGGGLCLVAVLGISLSAMGRLPQKSVAAVT